MKAAAVRAEFAKSASAEAAARDKTPEMTRGMIKSRGNLSRSGKGFESSRRASRIPTAGTRGRMDRAFMVQFRNAAIMNVPKIQSARKRESAFRFFQRSAPARER